MRTLLVFLSGILILSCKPSAKSDKDSSQLKQSYHGMDVCDTIKYQDSIIYNYSQYKITAIPHNGEAGDQIRIKRPGHSFILDEGASYFLGKYDNFIIIDEGTGIQRGISLIDLQSEKKIVSFEYIAGLDSLNFSNKKMYCYISNIPREERKRKNVPNCSEIPEAQYYDGGGILLELIIFDLRVRKIIYTG